MFIGSETMSLMRSLKWFLVTQNKHPPTPTPKVHISVCLTIRTQFTSQLNTKPSIAGSYLGEWGGGSPRRLPSSP